LNSKYKPLVIGMVTLGALDTIGVVSMIVNPDLTERIIPALVAIQIVGFIVIAIVYMIRTQTQQGTGTPPVGSTDSLSESEKAQRPRWRRMRWLWLAIAFFGILQTPIAIISAIHDANTDHRLAPVMVLAFAIRFGMIWLFLKLWWQSRPIDQ